DCAFSRTPPARLLAVRIGPGDGGRARDCRMVLHLRAAGNSSVLDRGVRSQAVPLCGMFQWKGVRSAFSMTPDANRSHGHSSNTAPRGFLWGAASAGDQVEANNINSDLWVLEHIHPPLFVEPSLDACDPYPRFAEDIRMLAGLGLN